MKKTVFLIFEADRPNESCFLFDIRDQRKISHRGVFSKKFMSLSHSEYEGSKSKNEGHEGLVGPDVRQKIKNHSHFRT